MTRLYTKCKFCGKQNIHVDKEIKMTKMFTRTEIIDSYKSFFKLESVILTEEDHIIFDCVESMIEDKIKILEN